VEAGYFFVPLGATLDSHYVSGKELLTQRLKFFLGQKTALKTQFNEENKSIYPGIGKKEEDDSWIWKTAKIKDTEIAEILRVLQQKTENASFYNIFNGSETKIWINGKDQTVFLKIEDQAKGLSPAKQEVLRIVLEETILQTSISRCAKNGGNHRRNDRDGHRQRKSRPSMGKLPPSQQRKKPLLKK
jgi:hypothetical protein